MHCFCLSLRLIDSDDPHTDISHIFVRIFIQDSCKFQRSGRVNDDAGIQQNPEMLNIRNLHVFQCGPVDVSDPGISQHSFVGSS